MGEPSKNPLALDVSLPALLKFALPSMAGMIFMGLYTIGDTVIVARLVNTDALSAINIATPIINIIVGLGTMLATGGSAIIAGKMGAGKLTEAWQDFSLITVSGAALGIAIAILGTLLMDRLIWSLGASQRLFPYCKAYLSILLVFTPASILQVLFQNLIITAGRPGLGMAFSVGAGAVNVFLDCLFIHFFEMGIQGSALGTGVGYLISAALGGAFFLSGKGHLKFRRPVLRLKVLAISCSNGCSELVSQASSAVTTFLFNRSMMGLLGEDGVAAVTIMIYLQFLLTTLFIGFSMGTAPVISYYYGRKDLLSLKKIFRICLGLTSGISVFVFLFTIGFGSFLAGIFSPKGTPVYAITREGFSIFPFAFLFCGINIFASAAFTALSDGKRSAFLSFLRTFGLITVFLLTLPEIFGVRGVWMAVPAAELITMTIAIFLIRRFWMQRKSPDF